jgi:hypothetical protein
LVTSTVMVDAAADELTGGAALLCAPEGAAEEPGFALLDELLQASSAPVATTAASVKHRAGRPPRTGFKRTGAR